MHYTVVPPGVCQFVQHTMWHMHGFAHHVNAAKGKHAYNINCYGLLQHSICIPTMCNYARHVSAKSFMYILVLIYYCTHGSVNGIIMIVACISLYSAMCVCACSFNQFRTVAVSA